METVEDVTFEDGRNAITETVEFRGIATDILHAVELMLNWGMASHVEFTRRKGLIPFLEIVHGYPNDAFACVIL